MLPLLLLLGIEAIAALRTKAEVRLYFITQFIGSIVYYLAEGAWGLDSDYYRLAYSIVDIVILGVSFKLVWKQGIRWGFLTAILVSLVPIAFLGLGSHQVSGVDFWITAIEGFLLSTLGAALGPKAIFRSDLVGVCLIWLLLAGYDFHFLLDPHNSTFEAIAPIWIVASGALWVALFPSQEQAPQLELSNNPRP